MKMEKQFTPAPQKISEEVLLEKYAKEGETSELDIFNRVSHALASAEVQPAAWQPVFLKALQDGFIGAGRIMSSAGTDIQATLINCFVQPIGDSMIGMDDDGYPGITVALSEAAETMRRGGGVGYDYSRIRPSGSRVKGTHSVASGPISYLELFNSMCKTVESAGARRGAQMGVLRCDHPDIMSFITAKNTEGRFTQFNLSVGVTDAFMESVVSDGDWDLVHKASPANMDGKHKRDDGLWVYSTIKARKLFKIIMEQTYDHAEPGILFIDRMNEQNNLHYCETIEACNPCAEQPLPSYGACCLGSINLSKYVSDPFSDNASFDLDAFKVTVATSVRMLDNVLEITLYPLEQQKESSHSKRRIGLGFTGLGDMLIMLGIPYNTEEARVMAGAISEAMRDTAYATSVELAIEKGAFPLFNADAYLQSNFIKRLPESLRDAIRKHGIRNSHLLSIAPTGSISLAFADNASNGIEPPFSWTYDRKKRMADGSYQHYLVEDHAFRVFRDTGGDIDHLPASFVSALEMSVQDHVAMLERVQKFVDTSISKTVNIPEEYPFSDFENLYMLAWRSGLKGLATYRPNAILGSVLSVPSTEQKAEVLADVKKDEDPLKKQFERRPMGDLDAVIRKVEYSSSEGKKTVYLAISYQTVEGVHEGEPVVIERPVEFFMPAGQRTEGQQWIASTMRLLSMAARLGGSIAKALDDLREVVWDKGPVRCGFIEKDDGTQVPRYHESEVAAIGYSLQRILIKRNFLDADGNQVPVKALAQSYSNRHRMPEEIIVEPVKQAPVNGNKLIAGKRCKSCGAHNVIRKDGCDFCTNCSEIGSCG